MVRLSLSNYLLKRCNLFSGLCVQLMTMKLLEWKSFAIGALLTTTVVLGTGASNKSTKNLLEKIEISSWDKNQQWEIKTSNGKNIPKGWEPFAYDSNDNFDPVLLRRRIK